MRHGRRGLPTRRASPNRHARRRRQGVLLKSWALVVLPDRWKFRGMLHKIGDANVIQRLGKIVAGVDEGSWGALTNLAAGHALA
jgi:hypothetical protein